MRRSSSPRAEEQRDRERDREKDHERDRERERDRKGRSEKKDSSSRDRDRDRRDKESRHGGDDDKRRDRDRPRDDADREFGRETRKDRKDKDRDTKDRGKEEQKSRKDREKERDRDTKDTGKEELKPRKDGDKEEKEQSNKEKEAVLENKPTEDFEERIARMREARLKEKSSSRTKNEDDIAAWVNKSRKLEKVKKPRAAMAKAIEEPDEGEEVVSDDENSAYNSKHLAGLKIRHGLDKVMEGGEVVLTLKDSNILAGEDLNEDPDELENVSIAEQKARQSAYQAAKKKPGMHEDKFQNDINGIRTILPQYDDAVNDEGIVLDESGAINEESERKLKEVREKLQGAALKSESLNGPAGMRTDYYTQEEMLQFKKPKKQKKLRKKDMLDVDALEAEAKAAGLGAGDLGTRDGTRSLKEEELKAEAASRKQAYESAFAKASEASKALRGDAMEVDTEDDDELYRSLQKTRQAALKKRAASVLGPQGVARLAALHRESFESRDGEKDVEKPASEKPVVITDTEEFCLSLQLDEALSRRSAGKDVFGDDDEDGPSEDKPMEGQGGWIEVNATDTAGPALDIDKDDETSDELPIKEVSVGKGLAGVLQLLSERGNLKESVEWGGRNMDKKPSKLIGIMNDGDKAPERDILLDRRDEYGRVMTPKEAFRKLSHKFHGKGPGKKKQEKKMKQYEEELKLKQMRSGDTPLMSMEKMREAQARMHTPYIVISGHIKPGQTSDPRSGFATVEKEPIGSLTPMLGDKKVEHFLGIKRKPESGIPPLPPKKPKT